MSDAQGTYGHHLRVLALLRESRDAESIPLVLERIEVASMLHDRPEEICAEIDKGAGALLIEEEMLSPRTKELLVGKLKGQPSWSELPIIVLLRQGPETQAARDALLLPGDVTLVERPVRVNTLIAIVRSALRSRSRQYLMRDQLLALDRANEELEVRVQERTKELTTALERVRSETEERLLGVQELRWKDQLLMQQSRLTAMGEMIGFIAHQWRQPLNALGLIAQEMSFRYQKGFFDQQYVDTATADLMRIIRQMSQTIDDFRNFFKSEKVKTSFRIVDILANTIKLVEGSFRELSVQIDVSAEEDVVAHGYPNEYSQVLLNILMNARDVCLERKVEQPRIVIRVFREGNKAVTTIADNAGGVPEELMERIFDPYFTTKGPDSGTGVGLYMAKTIVEKNMEGRLTVRNTSEGAEFRIEV